MTIIKLSGSVRQITPSYLIMELDPVSHTKLSNVLERLPETSSKKYIHPSGSFLIKQNGRTKYENASGIIYSDISELIGITISCTIVYTYYKFKDEFGVNDGYTFKAAAIKV